MRQTPTHLLRVAFTNLAVDGIDAVEKQLFDAIDGQRSIAEILDNVPMRKGQNKERARTFFERLWWYDQVVFNASKSLNSSREGV